MKEWDDVAAKLPQGLSEDRYNQVRNAYYKQKIEPRIQPGEDHAATYNEFLKRTNRTALHVGESLATTAAMLATAELPVAAVGPVVEAFGLPGAVARIAGGGAGWATYNALQAKDGDRVAAGLRGAATGALIETGVGALLGFGSHEMGKVVDDTLKEEAAKAVPKPNPSAAKMMDDWEEAVGAQPPISPDDVAEIEKRLKDKHEFEEAMRAMSPPAVSGTRQPLSNFGKVTSDVLDNTVKEARAKGYTTGPLTIDPSKRGLFLGITDAEGVKSVLPVQRGKESEAFGQVAELLDKGGSLDSVTAHPASQSRAVEFMRSFAEKAESEDQLIRMKVPKGRAGEVAKELNKYGLKGTVADETTVTVGPKAAWVKARDARELKQAGDEFVASGGKPPEIGDQTGKDLFRIGELRSRIENPDIPTTRADHQELHHLQGDVGARHGLGNRADIGKLGLRYFEQAVKGDAPDAAGMIERYVKGGAPRLEEGARPPVGNRGESASGVLKGFRIPTSESVEWDTDPLGIPGEIRLRPAGTTKRVSQSASELGWHGAQVTGSSGPLRVLAADASASDAYHEAIHDGLEHVGIHEDVPKLLKGEQETAQGIMRGLRGEFPSYDYMPTNNLANEAFTHAAEAVRMGDDAKLDQLARWDTSIDDVKKMVNTTAGRAWEASLSSESAPVRAFQRRMLDLVRRTSPDVSHELARAQQFGYTTWFDPELSQYVMRDGEGRELLKKDVNAVWDHIDQADPSSHFPDVAHQAYFSGVKGPIVPRGTEPVDGTTTLEWDGPTDMFGFQAAASISRPTLDSAASVQKILDKHGIDVDYYGAFARTDQAGKKAGVLYDNLKAERDVILKGVSGAKREAYGEVLRLPESQWDAQAAASNLNAADMVNIRALKDWDARNVSTGGTSLVNTLDQLHKVRANGGDWARAIGRNEVGKGIQNGALGYSSLNVGHISSWTMRQTVDNLHLSEPLKAIEDMAKLRTKSGELLFKQLQYPIRNYVNYMRGIPDAGQQILNSFVDAMSKGAGRQIAKFNKILPEGMKLPTDFGPPKALMSKFQLLQYTAGLGARPAVFIRDTFQAMQAAAIMGPSAFAEGLAKALTPEGRALADEAGAMIHGRNVSEMLGDVTKDLPASGRVSDLAVKAADKLMAPSRIGHNIGRTIAFLGEYSRALREIPRFRAGEIGAKDLAHATGAWFQDAAPMQRLLQMAADSKVPVEEVAKQFGLAMNDATQFPLRSGTQGAGLRTGLGRVFGQYGTWPMNYIEFVRKLAQRAAENPVKGVPAIAAWAAMNYGAFEAAQGLGIDAAKWLFFSPAGYAGSPNLELLQNIMTAPEESQAGLDARKKLHSAPFEFVPGGVEIDSILKAIDGGETNIPQLLGFKPLKDKPQQDFEDWLLTEGGYTGKSKTEIEDFLQ